MQPPIPTTHPHPGTQRNRSPIARAPARRGSRAVLPWTALQLRVEVNHHPVPEHRSQATHASERVSEHKGDTIPGFAEAAWTRVIINDSLGWTNSCSAPTSRRPCTFTLAAPSGASETSNLAILCAQRAASRGCSFALLARWRACFGHGTSHLVGEAGLLPRVCRTDGLLFRIADRDDVIEARDLEDAPVVVAEAVGQQLLLLAVDTD
jgi:hypothetical protein